MKFLKTVVFLFLTTILLSCTESDDTGTMSDNDDNPPIANSYVNLNTGNWWTYNNTTGTETTRDSLYIASTSTMGTDTNFDFEARQPATGIMTEILAGNSFRESNETLIMNGTIGIEIPDIIDLTLPVSNAVLYDANATTGSTLFTASGMQTQNIMGFDVDVNYTISSTADGTAASIMAGGQNFETIVNSSIRLNVSVVANVDVGGFPIPVTILPAQDVLVVENSWGGNVGLLISDSVLSYQLADFSQFGINLGVPDSATINSSQEIDTFNVN